MNLPGRYLIKLRTATIRGAHAPPRVVAGALASHIFASYTLSMSSPPTSRLGSVVVSTASVSVPPAVSPVRN